MSYQTPATSKTPALIIYLIDLSRSMNQQIGGCRKVDIVMSAMQKVLIRMVQRSTKGTNITPRYRVSMLGYHREVIDLLNGIQTINAVAERGIPKPQLDYGTQTAVGFTAVEQLLQIEMPHLQECPAPLVCHLTDGLYGGADPEPIVERIKNMVTPDGNVLVENIFVGKSILDKPIIDSTTWPGIIEADSLKKSYARKLFAMSSVIPDSYLMIMREFGYSLKPAARMLFPADNPDMVELGFVMSGATPVTR